MDFLSEVFASVTVSSFLISTSSFTGANGDFVSAERGSR